MPKELLRDMGLKDNEVKIYMLLLREGPSSVMRISKATGIERSLCYQVINQLAQKGLVSSSIRDNRRHYRAADPEHLHNIVDSKETELNILRSRLSDKLPSLQSLMSSGKGGEFRVDVYTGSDGCKMVRLKVLNETKEYFVIGYHRYMRGFSKHWRTNWMKERIKRKIKRKVLIAPEFKDSVSLKQPYTTVRLLPYTHKEDSPMSTMIFGKDKVLISLFTEEEYHGLLITSKQVHDSYLNYFNMLWKLSKKHPE